MAERDAEGSFLSRWSRRKRAVAEEEAEAEAVAGEEIADDPVALAEAEAQATREAEELAEMERNRLEAEAIDIDALAKGDDFSAFFKKGVPHLLKRQAMRKLWTTNPVFANLDGLNDYDEDFRNPAHNVYKSIWKAGRGFLSEAEQQAQRLTGRLRVEDDAPKLADEAEPAEVIAEAQSVEKVAEVEFAEEAGAADAQSVEIEPVVVSADASEAEPVTEAVAQETAEEAADGPEPIEEETPVRRRVSLRRRLEG
ncbi:DUF3306 domain-containing protein [Fulvimarina sp. MAC8]|uniref:DUF3306 domain-containing protein n=1 Tax=Fulvimarina sp. MAC8 TaxID=3162874 RepID=UPI0032EB7D2E